MKNFFYWLIWILYFRLKYILLKKLNSSIFSYVYKSTLGMYCGIEKGVSIYNSKIGDYTYFNKFTRAENCEIGRFTSVGEKVKIGGFYNHKNGISQHPSFHSKSPPIKVSFYKDIEFKSSKKIYIGNDVLIGSGAYILDGVKVGDGCIIGAKSIVTKSIPPYSIVVGNPGKVVKKRFDDDKVSILNKIKWWNWDFQKIKKNGQIISNTNFNSFK